MRFALFDYDGKLVALFRNVEHARAFCTLIDRDLYDLVELTNTKDENISMKGDDK